MDNNTIATSLTRYALPVWALACVAVLVIGFSCDPRAAATVSTVSQESGESPQPTPAAVVAGVVLLGTSDSISICPGTHLSPARLAVVAAQVDRVTARYMTRPEWRQAFVGLLCIESGYNSAAHSSAGAVGIAQLMPKYAGYFAEECGLGQVSEVDLLDTEVNLTLGACHFSKLLESFEGNIALALAGYNSGQDSETTKRLSHLVEGHPETMGYLAKFYVYLNKLQLAQQKGK